MLSETLSLVTYLSSPARGNGCVPIFAVQLYDRLLPSLGPSARRKICSAATMLLPSSNNPAQASFSQMAHTLRLAAIRAFPHGDAAMIEHAEFLIAAVVAVADSNATTPSSASGGSSGSVLGTIPGQLQSQLDSMNEMSEMASMRLQMAMDRRSKFVEALSNIMKQIDSTSETIVQNMK